MHGCAHTTVRLVPMLVGRRPARPRLEDRDDNELAILGLPALLIHRRRLVLQSHLVRGAAGTFVLNGFALVMGFVLALVLSRLLGASGYGAYTFAFASASLLTAPAVLGLTPVLVRNVSAYKAQGRWAELKGILCGAGATRATSSPRA